MGSLIDTKRALCAALIAAWSAPALPANLDTQAQELFNNLGMIGNYTAPGAYKGQTMNTYTGGNLFIRAPNKTYQLMSFQLPSIHAGCNGISAFGGAFSHISAQQFKDMLKSITSNIPGVIFDLAIKSVEPLLGSTMDQFKAFESWINTRNINSCEAAKKLVGAAGDALGINRYNVCESVAQTLGMATDGADAGQQCRDPAFLSSALNQGTANPGLAPAIPYSGNIVWDVLSKDKALDDDDKQLIMSITGTTVYSDVTSSADPALEPVVYPPVAGLTATALLNGTDGSGIDHAGNVQVQMYTCANPCTAPTLSMLPMKSIKARALDIMNKLSAMIQKGDETPGAEIVNFVNVVPVPVYQLIAVANATPTVGIADAKIGQYADYVAAEFAYALLSRMVTSAKSVGLSNSSINNRAVSDVQRKALDAHARYAADMERNLNDERHLAAVRTQGFIAMAHDIQLLQRSMRASMPQQISHLLGYARANPIQ